MHTQVTEAPPLRAYHGDPDGSAESAAESAAWKQEAADLLRLLRECA